MRGCGKIKSNRCQAARGARPPLPRARSSNSGCKQNYSHQLPAVRPSSSPVSEFHMNFFQPPSSFFEGIFGLYTVKVLFFFFFFKRRTPSVQLSDPDPLQRHPARSGQIPPNINRWTPAPPASISYLVEGGAPSANQRAREPCVTVTADGQNAYTCGGLNSLSCVFSYWCHVICIFVIKPFQ